MENRLGELTDFYVLKKSVQVQSIILELQYNEHALHNRQIWFLILALLIFTNYEILRNGLTSFQHLRIISTLYVFYLVYAKYLTHYKLNKVLLPFE